MRNRFYVIFVSYDNYELSNVSQQGYKTEREAIEVILDKIEERYLQRITDNCYRDLNNLITYIVKEITIAV